MPVVPGVCYGDMSSEVETEGNGVLHCRVGSLFSGRSSFHPGEAHEGLAGIPAGEYSLWFVCFGPFQTVGLITLWEAFQCVYFIYTVKFRRFT